VGRIRNGRASRAGDRLRSRDAIIYQGAFPNQEARAPVREITASRDGTAIISRVRDTTPSRSSPATVNRPEDTPRGTRSALLMERGLTAVAGIRHNK
jgi:hypothetical protein